MYKKLLTNKFFDDNIVDENTAQYFMYSIIKQPKIQRLAAECSRKLTDMADGEARIIETENDVQKLIKLLRGKCDPINHELLEEKVLEKEDEMLPIMINMAVKSGNDVFVEHLVKIIPKCKRNYSKELLTILNNIKYPYTKSLICLSLGFIGDEDIIPIMLDKFNELKRQNLNEDDHYEQGPLYGLWELRERFYRK